MFKIFSHTLFKKHLVKIICFLILSLSAFLRFYKAPDFFVMTTDEAYGFALAQTLADNFHIIWAGENASNTGFYMGPFWAYFTAFWLYISKSNLLLFPYLGGAIGVLTTAAVFITGKKLFNLKVASITSLLYAVLPLIVFFDKRYWIVSPIPLISVLLTLSIFMTRVSLWWWASVGILYGLVFHAHLSIAPLGIAVLYFLFTQRRELLKAKKVAAVAFMAFFITISPLVVFDYFHKGSNILTPFRVANSVEKSSEEIDPVGHLNDIFRSFGRVWYLYPGRPVADEVLYACSVFYNPPGTHTPGVSTQRSFHLFGISLFSALIMGWFFFRLKTWKNLNTKVVALSLLSILIGYTFFPMISLDYYLLGAFPLFLFIPAILTTSSKRFIRVFAVLAVIIFAILGVQTVLSGNGDYGLTAKINLVKEVMNVVGDDKFEIREEGNCQTNGGWRQIFKRFGKAPGRAPSDLSVGYLYPEEILKGPLRYRVVIYEKRISPPESAQGIIEAGGFWATIGKNW